MKTRIQLFTMWLFSAPLLLLEKLDVRWYVKLLLVILSPCTAFILFLLIILVSVATTPTMISFPVDHQLGGAKDISAITHSYIPPCDTIGAFYQSIGLDGTGYENFYMQHQLTTRELRKLEQACRHDSLWKNNPKEFIYSRYSNEKDKADPNNKIKYDKVVVRIPKQARHIKVELIHY